MIRTALSLIFALIRRTLALFKMFFPAVDMVVDMRDCPSSCPSSNPVDTLLREQNDGVRVMAAGTVAGKLR